MRKPASRLRSQVGDVLNLRCGGKCAVRQSIAANGRPTRPAGCLELPSASAVPKSRGRPRRGRPSKRRQNGNNQSRAGSDGGEGAETSNKVESRVPRNPQHGARDTATPQPPDRRRDRDTDKQPKHPAEPAPSNRQRGARRPRGAPHTITSRGQLRPWAKYGVPPECGGAIRPR